MNTELIRYVDGVEVPAAGVWQLPPDWASIEFRCRRLLGRTVRGQVRLHDGAILISEDPADSFAALSFDATSLDTRNTRRDARLRDVILDAENHPTIELSVDAVRLLNRSQWAASASLTLRGKNQPLTVVINYDGVYRRGPSALFRAHTRVSAADLGFGLRRFGLSRLSTWALKVDVFVELHAQLVEHDARTTRPAVIAS